MSIRLNPYCDPRIDFPVSRVSVRKIGTKITKDSKVSSALVRSKCFSLPDYLEIVSVTSYQLMDDFYFTMNVDIDKEKVAFLPVHQIEYTIGPRVFSVVCISTGVELGKVSEEARIRSSYGMFRTLRELRDNEELVDLIIANRVNEDTLVYEHRSTRVVLQEITREPVASISLWDPYDTGNKFKFLPITLASGMTVI